MWHVQLLRVQCNHVLIVKIGLSQVHTPVAVQRMWADAAVHASGDQIVFPHKYFSHEYDDSFSHHAYVGVML
jgi:hypothetical protein